MKEMACIINLENAEEAKKSSGSLPSVVHKVRRNKKVSHVARICSWCNENTFLMLQLIRPVYVAQGTMHGQL